MPVLEEIQAKEMSIEGLDELFKRLDGIADPNLGQTMLVAGGEHLRGVIAQYPPATAANQPRPGQTWYERGYGTRWGRKDGSIGGRKSSEALGRGWNVQAESARRVVVANSASYGPLVQSAQHQAPFHAARGWITDEQVIEQEAETVMAFFVNEIDRILGG